VIVRFARGIRFRQLSRRVQRVWIGFGKRSLCSRHIGSLQRLKILTVEIRKEWNIQLVNWENEAWARGTQFDLQVFVLLIFGYTSG
jgi:hypothetical protein